MNGFERALRALALVAGFVVILLMLFTVLDVILRYFFNAPFRGSVEVTEFSMAIIIFFGLAYCGLVGGHISVDLLEKFFLRPSLRFVHVAVCLVGAALFALIAWQAVNETLLSWGQTSNMLRMPHYPFRLVAAFGCALYAVVLLIQAFRPATSSGGH